MTDVKFDDLHDPMFDAPIAPVAKRTGDYLADNGGRQRTINEGKFVEGCDKCGGSGKFISWSGRRVGQCFACKGKGELTFKTSPEQRAAQKARREAGKARKFQRLHQALADFREQHADVWELLTSNENARNPNDFLWSLNEQLHRRGELSERQMAACGKFIAKRREWAEQRAAEPTSGVDLSGVPSGLYLVADHRLRIDNVESGKWAGWVFVKTESGEKVGNQRPGAEYRGKLVEELRGLADDPQCASAAYGRLTGTCGVCSRTLTNPESIELGIGPVCRSRFGG
jgi:hypothetical protein